MLLLKWKINIFGDRITVNGKHGTFNHYGETKNGCAVSFDGEGISLVDEDSITITFNSFVGFPEKLIGKIVLYTFDMSYSKNRTIRRITKITKTSFKIENEDALFNFQGRLRGIGNSRSDIGRVGFCTLITEEEADIYRAEWKKKREIKEMIATINNIEWSKFSYEKLIEITKFLQK